jgi:Ca2+-transporting ATPase
VVERDLIFLGLILMADPPRPEAIQAVADCHNAGIKVVMITGDHPRTAHAIACELGISSPERKDVLTGLELNRMTQSDLDQKVEDIAVYARVSPEDKLRILKAWKSRGHIVAMTGDGVNDAPALRQANIGVAMGKGGTEVARQAASMILTDDNFATLSAAVEEGRAVFGNIRRTVLYLLTGNFTEILIMLGAVVLGWPEPSDSS